jgi:hypothetical protein
VAIIRLVYLSECEIDPAEESVVKQLSLILSASNRNNKQNGLTGALVFDGRTFLQTLEGERDSVLKTYERIKKDHRHSTVTLVGMREITARMFGNWWMGAVRLNSSSEEALRPYLTNGLLRPHDMSEEQILDLMGVVSKLGLSRKIA